MEKSLQETMFIEFKEKLKKKRQASVEYTTQQVVPHDEYTVHVGLIRGLDEAINDLTELMEIYFPVTE